MADIFVGAAIILVPLGIFLFVMLRDLCFEEKNLMKRAERLRRLHINLKPRVQPDSKIIDRVDLDDGDAKLLARYSRRSEGRR